MKPRQDPARMQRLLARRRHHGWSWAELSRRSGLPVWKLRWWHRRLATNGPARRPGRTFLPVQVVDPARRDVAPLELVTPAGIRILVAANFEADHLRRVLRALEPAC